MIEKYGENAYTDGYKVYTTVKRKDQLSAEDAVHTGIIDYDMRHGYRGAQQVLWPQNSTAWDTEQIPEQTENVTGLRPAQSGVVLSADANCAQAMLKDGSTHRPDHGTACAGRANLSLIALWVRHRVKW